MRKYIIIITMLINAMFVFGEDARVVSLAPAVTEIVYFIGSEKNLVGVTSVCDYPDEAKQKEKVGDFTNPNMERIVSLKPTIVIGMDLNEKKMARFRELGIKYINLKCDTISQIGEAIQIIGKLCNNEAVGLEKSKEFIRKIEEIKKRSIYRKNRPKVFVVIYDKPYITAAKGSIVDEVIEIAGGENIAGESREPYPLYSVESVIAARPDIIITEKNMNIERIKGTSMVINDIDPSLYMRAGPRIIKGIEIFYEKFDKTEKK